VKPADTVPDRGETAENLLKRVPIPVDCSPSLIYVYIRVRMAEMVRQQSEAIPGRKSRPGRAIAAISNRIPVTPNKKQDVR